MPRPDRPIGFDDDVAFSEELVALFLEEFTQPGDLVFDPFAGFSLAAEPHRRRLRLLRVAVAALLLLALSAGLALASPDLRAWLGGVAVSISGSSRGVASLEPAPTFTVLQPDLAALPGGWLLLATGYNPGPAPSATPGRSAASGAAPSVSGLTVARRVGGQDLAPTTNELAQARAQDLLGRGDEVTLVLVYQDPTGQLVQVRERAAAGKTLPSGQLTTVHAQAGAIAQRGDEEVLTFTLEGTLVEISGSAERAARSAASGNPRQARAFRWSQCARLPFERCALVAWLEAGAMIGAWAAAV